MGKIKNTAREEINYGWVLGGNPNAIENQEAEGQKQLVESSQLPKYLNGAPGEGETALKKYEELGIEVMGFDESDDLFVEVKLPDGWEVKNTDHSMWSKLLNEKGEEIGSIFYKAAFYDRRAFIGFK